MGIPDPSFSFGRILEVMLRQRYPEARFEVVNAAITAINSHVILDIAKDCASQGADIFVVYMGNNEVTGPYGPGTVFGQWSRRLATVRAAIWLKSTGVGQWLSDAVDWFRGVQGAPAVWQGMAMCLENPIAADDSRLGLVYDSIRENLADLCDVARRAGAEVILSTVAVNLEDFPPLASRHRSGLLPEERTRWESIYQAAVAAESTGDLPNAIQQYQEAARIDDRFADLQFRLGRCLAAAGRHSEAAEHYRLARDLDALRFRADSRVNQILREYAAARGTDGVRLADGERAMDEIARDRRASFGGKLFRDHVHLTFDGNYLLAKAILEQLEQALPEEIRPRPSKPRDERSPWHPASRSNPLSQPYRRGSQTMNAGPGA